MCRPTTARPLPPALLSKLRWRLIPPLWLGFALNVINRSNVAFAQIQMSGALGLSQADFGFAAGIFFCSYALVQVPSNILLSRVGARAILAADLFLWGLVSAATGLVANAYQLSVLRFLLGLAQSGYYSGCLLYLRTWFPSRESATAVAIFVTSGAAGTIACSLTSGVIMSACDGLLGLGGWRWLFLVQGVPPLLLGALLPLLLANAPTEAAWLTGKEAEQLLGALERDALAEETSEEAPDAPAAPAAAFRDALGRLPTWLFMAQYFALNTVTYTVMFFLPVQLTQIFPALDTWQIGLLTAVPAALKIALGPPVAAIADCRSDGARFSIAWSLFACCGLSVAGASAFMLRGPSEAIPLALLLASLCEGCAVAIFWSVHHRRQPLRVSACSIALVNSFGNLGGFCGTYVLGYLHDTLGAASRRHGELEQSSESVGDPLVAPTETVSDWGWGTAVVGAGFLLVTCATATCLQVAPVRFASLPSSSPRFFPWRRNASSSMPSDDAPVHSRLSSPFLSSSPSPTPPQHALSASARENMRGALVCVAGMGAFVLCDAFSKSGVATFGVPVLQMLALRAAGMVLFFSAIVWHTRDGCDGSVWHGSVSRRGGWLLGARALLEGLGSWLFTLGLVHLPMASATAIVQALPLVVMLATALHGEPVGGASWAVALVGFGGVLVIVQPSAEGISPWAACTLLAVLCMAARDVATRSLGRRVASSVVALAGSAGLLGFSSAVSLLQSEEWVALDAWQLGCVAGATLFACGGFFSSVELMRRGSVAFVQPFRYTLLLWAAVLGWLFFGERPDAPTVLGSAILVVTGYASVRIEQTRAEGETCAGAADVGGEGGKPARGKVLL